MSQDEYAANNAWWAYQLATLSDVMARAGGCGITFRIHRSGCDSVFGYYRENFFLPAARVQPHGWLIDLLDKLKELGYQPELNLATACTGGIGLGVHLYGEVFVPFSKRAGCETYDMRFARACFCKDPDSETFLADLIRNRVWLFTVTGLAVLFGLAVQKLTSGF